MPESSNKVYAVMREFGFHDGSTVRVTLGHYSSKAGAAAREQQERAKQAQLGSMAVRMGAGSLPVPEILGELGLAGMRVFTAEAELHGEIAKPPAPKLILTGRS